MLDLLGLVLEFRPFSVAEPRAKLGTGGVVGVIVVGVAGRGLVVVDDLLHVPHLLLLLGGQLLAEEGPHEALHRELHRVVEAAYSVVFLKRVGVVGGELAVHDVVGAMIVRDVALDLYRSSVKR